AGLALEGLTQAGHGAEPDGAGAAVLEHGQVHDRDVDLGGQLGERHPPRGQQLVEADVDGDGLRGRDVVVVLLRRPPAHTVPWRSSSIWAPSRKMRPKVSSAAPTSTGTGNRAWTVPVIASP